MQHNLVYLQRKAYAAISHALNSENYDIGGKYLRQFSSESDKNEVTSLSGKIRKRQGEFGHLSLIQANRESLVQFTCSLLGIDNPTSIRNMVNQFAENNFGVNHYTKLEKEFRNQGIPETQIPDKIRQQIFEDFIRKLNRFEPSTNKINVFRLFFDDRLQTERALNQRKRLREDFEDAKTFNDIEDPNCIYLNSSQRWGIKGLDLLFRRTLLVPAHKKPISYEEHKIKMRLLQQSQQLQRSQNEQPTSANQTPSSSDETKPQYKSKRKKSSSPSSSTSSAPATTTSSSSPPSASSVENPPSTTKPNEIKEALSKAGVNLEMVKNATVTTEEITGPNGKKVETKICTIPELNILTNQNDVNQLNTILQTLQNIGLTTRINKLTLKIPSERIIDTVNLGSLQQIGTLRVEKTGGKAQSVNIQNARAKNIIIGQNLTAKLEPVDLEKTPVKKVALEQQATLRLTQQNLEKLVASNPAFTLGQGAKIEIVKEDGSTTTLSTESPIEIEQTGSKLRYSLVQNPDIQETTFTLKKEILPKAENKEDLKTKTLSEIYQELGEIIRRETTTTREFNNFMAGTSDYHDPKWTEYENQLKRIREKKQNLHSLLAPIELKIISEIMGITQEVQSKIDKDPGGLHLDYMRIKDFIIDFLSANNADEEVDQITTELEDKIQSFNGKIKRNVPSFTPNVQGIEDLLRKHREYMNKKLNEI